VDVHGQLNSNIIMVN